MFRHTSQCLLTAALTFLFTAYAASQDLDQVNFSGKITDINGDAVVGATVSATGESNGSERTVVSDSSGSFRIIELPPGVYSITATAKGFAVNKRTGIGTFSGQGIQINFELSPAGVTVEQTVRVGDADRALIDTTRTVVGSTLTEREIDEIPNLSRDPLDLVFLLGGVSEEPLSTRDLSFDKGGRGERGNRNTPEEAGVFALSGGAAYSNNITIDGFDNNDDRAASSRFQPSIESISEVQVITNQFSAEYGRASGGRVNILTKPGSRKFRGRIYDYFRDDRINANSWSNNRRGVARPKFTQNIAGITLGGPISFGYFKNKTYYYGAYEYDHFFDSTITDTWVPLTQNPLFPLPSPTSDEIITDWPDDPDLATNLGRFVMPADTPRKRHRLTARIDHSFSSRNYFTFRYQFGKAIDKRQFNGGNRLAETLVGKRADTRAVNFTQNLVLSGNAVNQFKMQYSTLKPKLIADGQFSNPVVLISFREPGRRSNTTLVAGSSTLGSSVRRETRWQVQDTHNQVFASNVLRFGFDVHRIDSTHVDLSDASGTFNFGSPLSSTTVPQCLIDANNPGLGRIRSGAHAYARGCVRRYRHRFFTDSNIKNTYFGLFAQNEWRLRTNISLNFGLRYERESVIRDTNNFGPRFAIAWSPFADNRGVIRFGAGIFYNRVLLRTVDDYRRGTGEIIFDTNRVTASGQQRDQYLLALSNGFPGVLTADSPLVRQYVEAGLNRNRFFRSLDPQLKIPESYQFNLGFEHAIGGSLVFEANLTFNRTIRLWRETNTNAPAVPAGFSDLADYLANGIRTGSIRFEFAGITSPDKRVLSGITYYNLDSQNPSTAASTPHGRALAVANTLRPQPDLGQTERVGSLGSSRYRGLVVELRRRYRGTESGFGFSTRAVYTFSYLEDDGIVNTSSAQTPGDFRSEFSRSLSDRRHRIAVTGLLVVPDWLGGLRLAPVFRFGSGAPFNLSNGGSVSDDRNLDDVNTDRPNFSGRLNDLKWRRMTDPLNRSVLEALTLAPIGRAGNLGRNAGKGPRQYVFDLNISREFRITDRVKMRPQIEIANLLNMTVYSFGSEFIDASAITNNPDPQDLVMFLAPTRTFRPRKIRFGVRIDF